MKIISLNVNGFRGMTKQGEHVPNSKLVENLNALKNYIDDINIDDKPIIFTPEVYRSAPYSEWY